MENTNDNVTTEIVYEEESLPSHIISTFFNLAVMLFAAFFIFLFVRYEPRYIVSGSMEPTVHVGALTFIDAQAYAKGQDPEVGDIVLYRAASGREILHRVKRVEKSEDGSEAEIYCQGDNNETEDFAPVEKMQIVGKTKYVVNFVAPLVRAVRHLDPNA